mmetsp:Transcript_46401/g.121783  ORF Transcript_46401/g.121783 Transcript_46401/m.121783 type:complete len:337 (+) Transcript_46401:1176-2186(+)
MPPSLKRECRRDMPVELLKRIRAFEAVTGHRVRFRSFTLLRSPLSLAHSQFTYWHAATLPRRLYYQLSPELLLFGDGLKRLRSNLHKHESNVCFAWGEERGMGGVFLGLPFSKKSSASKEQHVCSGRQWRTMCQDVMLALTKRWANPRQRWLLPASLLKCGNITRTTIPFRAAAAAAIEMALGTMPSNATYDDLDAWLASVLCPAARRRLLQTTQCLVGHAKHVQQAIDELGCDAMIRQALGRLGQLSHVLFMDASKFTLQHAFDMALRGTDGAEANASSRSLRVNEGISHEPFIMSEMEPFNRCSLRFCTSQQTNYTSRTQGCLWQCFVHNIELD